MGRFLHLRFANYWRKYAAFTLAFCWIFGLIFGVLIARNVSIEALPLVDSLQNHVPGSLLTVMLFPVAVSVLVMYMDQSWLIPLIAFLKSFSFAYVSWILMQSFGTARWLMQFLMMFSDCLSLPLLWWFWHRLLKSARSSLFQLSILMVLATLAIGMLDIRFISPILSSLQIS